MLKSQIILILSVLWLGMSLAKSVKPNSRHYEYTEVMRLSPTLIYRGKSATDARQQEGAFQKYWQNFVRNIPFRFNMTNSIGNLFNAGTQQIIEAPVGVHQDKEPNRRRRKQSKKKSSIKGTTKERKRSSSRGHKGYYNHAGSRSGYQLQLQPLGMDEENNMHFYDPRTGSYYALHLVSAPNQHYSHQQQQQQHYYNPHEDQEEDDDDDDQYYEGNDTNNFSGDSAEHFDEPWNDQETAEEYDDANGSTEHEYDDEGLQHNDYDAAEEEPYAEASDDYADDIQLVDNWGYNDDDIFGERKLKDKPFNFKVFPGQEMDDKQIPPTIVTINKKLLKPETEDDVKVLLKKKSEKPMERKLEHIPLASDDAETGKAHKRRIKPKSSRKTPEDIESESVRNILGSFMKDDSTNRRRQSAKPKAVKPQRLVEQPRERHLYFIYPHFVSQ